MQVWDSVEALSILFSFTQKDKIRPKLWLKMEEYFFILGPCSLVKSAATYSTGLLKIFIAVATAPCIMVVYTWIKNNCR